MHGWQHILKKRNEDGRYSGVLKSARNIVMVVESKVVIRLEFYTLKP